LEELNITIGVMSAYKGLVHTELDLSWVQIILFLLKEKPFFFEMIKGLAKFYVIYALQSSNCLNILYDQYWYVLCTHRSSSEEKSNIV
jgi:hypothetical protein